MRNSFTLYEIDGKYRVLTVPSPLSSSGIFTDYSRLKKPLKKYLERTLSGKTVGTGKNIAEVYGIERGENIHLFRNSDIGEYIKLKNQAHKFFEELDFGKYKKTFSRKNILKSLRPLIINSSPSERFSILFWPVFHRTFWNDKISKEKKVLDLFNHLQFAEVAIKWEKLLESRSRGFFGPSEKEYYGKIKIEIEETEPRPAIENFTKDFWREMEGDWKNCDIALTGYLLPYAAKLSGKDVERIGRWKK